MASLRFDVRLSKLNADLSPVKVAPHSGATVPLYRIFLLILHCGDLMWLNLRFPNGSFHKKPLGWTPLAVAKKPNWPKVQQPTNHANSHQLPGRFYSHSKCPKAKKTPESGGRNPEAMREEVNLRHIAKEKISGPVLSSRGMIYRLPNGLTP